LSGKEGVRRNCNGRLGGLEVLHPAEVAPAIDSLFEAREKPVLNFNQKTLPLGSGKGYLAGWGGKEEGQPLTIAKNGKPLHIPGDRSRDERLSRGENGVGLPSNVHGGNCAKPRSLRVQENRLGRKTFHIKDRKTNTAHWVEEIASLESINGQGKEVLAQKHMDFEACAENGGKRTYKDERE